MLGIPESSSVIASNATRGVQHPLKVCFIRTHIYPSLLTYGAMILIGHHQGLTQALTVKISTLCARLVQLAELKSRNEFANCVSVSTEIMQQFDSLVSCLAQTQAQWELLAGDQP
jgi:hypothetical protein